MIEQEVDVKVFATNVEVVLAPDEGEPDTEFEEERADVLEEPTLKLSLVGVVAQREEVKVVRVFQELMGEVGLQDWEASPRSS